MLNHSIKLLRQMHCHLTPVYNAAIEYWNDPEHDEEDLEGFDSAEAYAEEMSLTIFNVSEITVEDTPNGCLIKETMEWNPEMTEEFLVRESYQDVVETIKYLQSFYYTNDYAAEDGKKLQ